MAPIRIVKVVLVLIGLFILYWVFFGRKSSSSSDSSSQRFGAGVITFRKGESYCVKMCGDAGNKACMDECKTKTGFYGCC